MSVNGSAPPRLPTKAGATFSKAKSLALFAKIKRSTSTVTVSIVVGTSVGNDEGMSVGTGAGTRVGICVGAGVGTRVGSGIGAGVGTRVGNDEGTVVSVGETVCVGISVRVGTGVSVGANVGYCRIKDKIVDGDKKEDSKREKM